MLDTKEVVDLVNKIKESGNVELFIQAAILGQLHEINMSLSNLNESTESVGGIFEALDETNKKLQQSNARGSKKNERN